MTAPISPVQPLQVIPHQGPFLSKELKALIKIIVQIACQLFFVIAVALTVAASLPLVYHTMAIPAAILTGSMISSFFFHRVISGVGYIPQIGDVMPAHMPLDAPRGIDRQGMNCSFNALVHFLESDPQIRQWIRNLIPKDANMEALLGRYQVEPQVIADFRAQEGALPAFIANYNPPAAVPNYQNFREIFTNCLLPMDAPFGQFFAAYDQAYQGNQAVANNDSQQLRVALSNIPGSTISRNNRVQHDAHEVLNHIFRGLPDAQKMRVEEATHYDVGDHPIARIPDGIIRKEAVSFCFELAVRGIAPNLAALFRDHCNEVITDPGSGVNQVGVDGQTRRYSARHKEFRLLEAPSVLRFQLNRVLVVPPVSSCLTNWLPDWFPRLGYRTEKNHTPVEIPEEMEIALRDGTVHRHRLASFVNHWGNTPDSGHYTAGRVVDGRYYFMDDTKVTLVDRDTWYKLASQTYLLSYLPVAAG